MPIVTFESLDQLPEEMRAEAKKTEDGKFTINLVSAKSLDEFRNRNIEASRNLEMLDAKYKAFRKLAPTEDVGDEDIIKEFNDLRGLAQRVKDGSLKASDAIEKELETRTATLRASLQERLDAATQETAKERKAREDAETRWRSAQIDRAINAAALDPVAGVIPRALPDVLNRARRIFTVDENGNLTAKDATGLTLRGENGVDPLTPAEWLKSLRKEADYLFMSSRGGGAGGGGVGNDDHSGQLSAAEIAKMTPSEKIAYGRKLAAAKK